MNNSNYTFSFKFETQEKFSKLIQNLNCNKATQQLKENGEIFSYILCHNFNNSLFSKVFPSSLKKADITPVYKKDKKFLKSNYRPVKNETITSSSNEKLLGYYSIISLISMNMSLHYARKPPRI